MAMIEDDPNLSEPGDDEENWSEIWQEDAVATLEGVMMKNSSSKRDLLEKGGREEIISNQNNMKCNSDQNNLMSRMKLNDNKAGMEGLDKAKINQIIYEASKGSKFYKNELKKEEQVNKRVLEQQRKLEKLTKQQIQYGETQADQILVDIEKSRDLKRTIVHIDMDAFYAAVEMRDNPELRNKPMAVGGNDMLSTSNYIARRYGVRAAMPGFIAKKLCPDLVIVKTNFEKYTSVSQEIREVLYQYDLNLCPMSLDEAYLDITDHLVSRLMSSVEERTFSKRVAPEQLCYCQRLPPKPDQIRSSTNVCHVTDSATGNLNNEAIDMADSAEVKVTDSARYQPQQQFESSDDDIYNTDGREINEKCKFCSKYLKATARGELVTFGTSVEDAVEEMRFRIEQKTQLTASAGLAPNMMLSKVCSDMNKPNGQYRIQPTREAVMEFVKSLPIRKICGIGKVTEKMLSALGLSKCSELYDKRGILYNLYSQISFNYFLRICLGVGSTKVERDGERKSISVERTFGEISRPAELYKKCYELCESLSQDLKNEEIIGKTVTIKLKTVEFKTMTRAQTLSTYTHAAEHIFPAARDLLRTEIQNCAPKPLRLRLMGVRLSNLLNQEHLKQNSIINMINKVQVKEEGIAKTNPELTSISDLLEKCKTESNSSTNRTQVATNYRLPFGAILLESSKISRKPEVEMHNHLVPSPKVNSADGNIKMEENTIPNYENNKSGVMSQQTENEAELDNTICDGSSESSILLLTGKVQNNITYDQSESCLTEACLPQTLPTSTTDTDVICPGSSPVSDKVSPSVLIPHSAQTLDTPDTVTGFTEMVRYSDVPDITPHIQQTSRESKNLELPMQYQSLSDAPDIPPASFTPNDDQNSFVKNYNTFHNGDVSYEGTDTLVDNRSDMTFTCPVCDSFQCLNLNQLNAHVDLCLKCGPLCQNTTTNVGTGRKSSHLQQTTTGNVGKPLESSLLHRNTTTNVDMSVESSSSHHNAKCFSLQTNAEIPGDLGTSRVQEWSKSYEKCCNCTSGRPEETPEHGCDQGRCKIHRNESCSCDPDSPTLNVTDSSADSLTTSDHINISVMQYSQEQVPTKQNTLVNESSMLLSTPRRGSKVSFVTKSTRSPRNLSAQSKSPKFTPKAKKMKESGKVNADDYTLPDTDGFSCPICDVTIYTANLNTFNHHVDSCLNRKTIKQILDQQKQDKSCMFGNQPSAKRRKVTDTSNRTLHSFFT